MIAGQVLDFEPDQGSVEDREFAVVPDSPGAVGQCRVRVPPRLDLGRAVAPCGYA